MQVEPSSPSRIISDSQKKQVDVDILLVLLSLNKMKSSYKSPAGLLTDTVILWTGYRLAVSAAWNE